MLTLIAYSFFCLFTLSASDVQLVQNKIKVPFANLEVDFFDFLLVGPLILVGLLIYLHIFIGYWRTIPRDKVPQPLPFLFNMQSRGPRLVTGFLFYWLVPLVLLTFIWKARPHGDVSFVVILTLVVAGSLLWIGIRHRPANRRRGAMYGLRWVMLAAVVGFGLKLTWQQLSVVGPDAVALATAIGQPVVLAIWSPEGEETGVTELPSEAAEDQVAAAPPPVAEPAPTDTSPGGMAAPMEPPAASPPPAPPAQVAQIQQQQQQLAPLTRSLNLAGADLRKADLANRNLRGADLREADLRSVVLRGDVKQSKDMQGANLSGADMGRARLELVDLSLAVLEAANLEAAHLVNVALFGAQLTKANLSGAVFNGVFAAQAVLREADFKDVDLSTTYLNGVDLRGARNLTCPQLISAPEWQTTFRDEALACGAVIPKPLKK